MCSPSLHARACQGVSYLYRLRVRVGGHPPKLLHEAVEVGDLFAERRIWLRIAWECAHQQQLRVWQPGSGHTPRRHRGWTGVRLQQYTGEWANERCMAQLCGWAQHLARSSSSRRRTPAATGSAVCPTLPILFVPMRITAHSGLIASTSPCCTRQVTCCTSSPPIPRFSALYGCA
eukprot:COSAG02_NODE_6558_length_3495_cov_9.279152_4_plen_175_part_00